MPSEAGEEIQEARRLTGEKPETPELARTIKPIAVSIPDFCAMVGCKRSLGFDLIRRHEVVSAKLGSRTVVTVASIEAMIERKSRPGPTS